MIIDLDYFVENYNKRVVEISKKQISNDRLDPETTIYKENLKLIKQEYKEFLEFCYKNNKFIVSNKNMYENILAMFKYCKKYIGTDVDMWYYKFLDLDNKYLIENLKMQLQHKQKELDYYKNKFGSSI